MKISYQLLLPLLCLFGATSLYSMEEEHNFDITIYNNVKGFLGYYIPVKGTYTRGKSEISNFIQGNNILDWTSYKAIKPNTQLKFEGYGEKYGLEVKESTIDQNILQKKWGEVKKTNKDTLVITITAKGFRPPYTLDFSYGTEIPKKIKEKEERYEKTGNPFMMFARIRHYKLQDALTENTVLNAKSWKNELVSGGYIAGATTAEDVYRYILSLPKDYTEASVKRSAKKLSLKWHPDKVIGKEKKEFANRVFLLVQKAQEGLLEALKEKGNNP